MIKEYKLMLKESRSKYHETKKLFKKLRTMKGSIVDNLFLSFHETISKRINCLDCANCCKGTGPLLKDRDLIRLSKTLGMKQKKFYESYVTVDEEGDKIFNQLPCPFLDRENLCMVYEDRPEACREYPHTDRKNMIKYLNPTLENYKICPIVYLIVEKIKGINL